MEHSEFSQWREGKFVEPVQVAVWQYLQKQNLGKPSDPEIQL